jgi:HlyD family secretion protein
MKNWRQITVLLLLSLVLTGIAACNAGGGEEAAAQQLVQVVRGDLTVLVDGTGNIEASREVKLSFGSGGKVEKIHVEEGDEVTKGSVLAELDNDALELAKTQAEVDRTKAEVALNQAQLALTQAELAQKTAEYNLKNTLDTEDALELVLLNAQIDSRDTEHNLDETQDIYTWPDIQTAQKDVENAEAFLQYALDRNLPDANIAYAQARLDAAEAVLDAKRNAYDTEEVAIARLQMEAAQLAEAQAQKNLDELAEDIALQELSVAAATESVEQAQESLELARQSIRLARQSLAQAQKNLDEATITAPFDGIIASVGADEGDTVTSAIIIVYLVDPMSMELIIEVDEVDIPGVRLNQETIISIDAIPHATFNGVVTSIYPVATTVSGIVMYNVRINLDLPENSDLKIGMSASADIIIDKRSNVLLLPSEAIKEDSQGNQAVKIMVDKQVQERLVITGISDGSETEILSGLSEDEIVVR